MQTDDWQLRWRTGQTGFHQSTVDRHLQAHWPSLQLTSGTRVLIPLCGKSLDVSWLRNAGNTVTGIDVSSIAIEALLLESGIPARRRSDTIPQTFLAPNLTAICGDFFCIDGFGLDPFPVIYDRAAFAAMPAGYRAAYVQSLLAVSSIGSRILIVLLEYPTHEHRGPPFSIGPDELRKRVAPWFSIVVLSRIDILASDARMQARGVTRLDEVCYLLERTQ